MFSVDNPYPKLSAALSKKIEGKSAAQLRDVLLYINELNTEKSINTMATWDNSRKCLEQLENKL